LNYQERLKELQQEYAIVATCGSIDPHISAPFIPIDALLGGSGKQRLHNIIEGLESDSQKNYFHVCLKKCVWNI